MYLWNVCKSQNDFLYRHEYFLSRVNGRFRRENDENHLKTNTVANALVTVPLNQESIEIKNYLKNMKSSINRIKSTKLTKHK